MQAIIVCLHHAQLKPSGWFNRLKGMSVFHTVMMVRGMLVFQGGDGASVVATYPYVAEFVALGGTTV